MVGLSRFSCPDAYTDASTLIQEGSVRLTFFVANNSILLQISDPKNPHIWNQLEIERVPGHYSLDRNCAAIRIRNSIAGKIAICTFELLTRDDVSDI